MGEIPAVIATAAAVLPTNPAIQNAIAGFYKRFSIFSQD